MVPNIRKTDLLKKNTKKITLNETMFHVVSVFVSEQVKSK